MIESENDETCECITFVHGGRWIRGRVISARVETWGGEGKAGRRLDRSALPNRARTQVVREVQKGVDNYMETYFSTQNEEMLKTHPPGGGP